MRQRIKVGMCVIGILLTQSTIAAQQATVLGAYSCAYTVSSALDTSDRSDDSFTIEKAKEIRIVRIEITKGANQPNEEVWDAGVETGRNAFCKLTAKTLNGDTKSYCEAPFRASVKDMKFPDVRARAYYGYEYDDSGKGQFHGQFRGLDPENYLVLGHDGFIESFLFGPLLVVHNGISCVRSTGH